MTGDHKDAGFSSIQAHHIVLQLDNKNLTGDLKRWAVSSKPYVVELNVPIDLKAGSQCIKRSDIREVRLEAGSGDGWLIKNIKTYVSDKSGVNQELTDNPTFGKWLDTDDKTLAHVELVASIERTCS